MIECYFGECRYHENAKGTDDGPFCCEDECRATDAELEIFIQQRKEYLESVYGVLK